MVGRDNKSLIIFGVWILILLYLFLPNRGWNSEETFNTSTASTASETSTTTETTTTTTDAITNSTTTNSTITDTVTTTDVESTSTESEIITTEENVIQEEEIIQEEEEVVQEEIEENIQEQIVVFQEPPRPSLKERKINKNFNISRQTPHRCEVENFSIDISGRQSVQVKLIFSGKKVNFGEVEIGNLPLGIDIKFSSNQDYLQTISSNDVFLVLEILNQEGSQKGNFNIPIIFTDKEKNESTICQMNVVNLESRS